MISHFDLKKKLNIELLLFHVNLNQYLKYYLILMLIFLLFDLNLYKKIFFEQNNFQKHLLLMGLNKGELMDKNI